LFGVPLLLLQNGPAHALSVTASASTVHSHGSRTSSALDTVDLPSHLVRYQAPATTTTVAPATTTTAPPATTTTTAAPVEVAHAVVAPPTTTTTTTTAPPAPTNSEVGEATWYAAAPDGYCASPTLPFGTVLTVTDNASGASITCTVDDREESPYPRVVDLSPQGFSQLADTSQGVVDVTISW
jgi:rare lipoprotein A (peptidoglycan hydrolase)